MLERFERAENAVFKKLFDMSHMEIEGFRSQRTILQFQLESVPQIFFQIYLWHRLDELGRLNERQKFGISQEAIEISIVCAIVHVIFEFFNILVEAKTADSPILNYAVACYNSRQRWIPRQNSLQQQAASEDEAK